MPTAVCPECEEDVYVDSDAEQGDLVTCDECGAGLEVVGLDPLELDPSSGEDDYDDFDDDFDDDDDEY